MPPKRLVQTAAKAKAKSKASSSSAVGVSPDKPSRHLGRRDTEDAAERAIAEHFPRSPKTVTHGKEVEGLTLFQRVVNDKRDAKRTGKRLGSQYWQDLREKYKDDDEEGELRVTNKGDPVDKPLIEALQAAVTANTTQRSKSLLISWLESATTVNQRELVGIARTLLPLKPEINQVAQQTIVSFMKLALRSKLKNTFPNEIAVLHDVMDRALLSTLVSMKRSSLEEETWWSLYKDISGLILDTAAVDRIYAATSTWCSVSSELSAVVASSATGRKLFGWALVFVVSERMQKLLASEFTALENKPINIDTIKQLNTKVLAEAEKNRCNEVLTTRRDIELQYRGIDIKVTVATFLEELHLRTSAFLKSQAIPTALCEMCFEQGLFEGIPKSQGANTTIDDSLLAEFKACRNLCTEMAKAVGQDGAVIVDFLQQKSQMFLNVDKSFVLEMTAFKALHNEKGIELAKEVVVASLATKKNPKTLAHSQQLLTNLAKGSLFKFGSCEVKAIIDQVREIISKMANGITISKSVMDTSPFLKEVLDKLPWFLSHSPKGSTDGIVYGTDAIPLKLKELQAAKVAGTLALDHLTEMHCFEWLCSEAQVHELSELTKGLLAGIQSSGKKNKAAASEAAAKKKAKASAEADMLDKLFG